MSLFAVSAQSPSLLGTKSFAYDKGIGAKAQPVKQVYMGGQWTLIYSKPTPKLTPAQARRRAVWLGSGSMILLFLILAVLGPSLA